MHAKYFAENAGINDPNLFEGDMILTPQQISNIENGLDVDSPGRKRGASKFRLWSGGIVVYAIDPILGKVLITIL